EVATADTVAETHVAAESLWAGARVQVGRRNFGNEELRAARVGSGVRVGKLARLVEIALVRDELVGDRIAGTARALPERIAALDHEVRDHAVEHRPVVEPLLRLLAGPGIGPLLLPLRQVDEVLHCIWLHGG